MAGGDFFWLGAAPLVVLPFVARYLPESLEFLIEKGRPGDARSLARRLGIPGAAIDATAYGRGARGVLAQAGAPLPWNFYAFAAGGVAAGITLMFVPASTPDGQSAN